MAWSTIAKHHTAFSLFVSVALAFFLGDSVFVNVIRDRKKLVHLLLQLHKQDPVYAYTYATIVIWQMIVCLQDPMVTGVSFLFSIMFTLLLEPFLSLTLSLHIVTFVFILAQAWCEIAINSVLYGDQNAMMHMQDMIDLKSRPFFVKLMFNVGSLSTRHIFFSLMAQTQPAYVKTLIEFLDHHPVSHLLIEWTLFFK